QHLAARRGHRRGHAAHALQATAGRRDAKTGRDDDRLGGRAHPRAGARVGISRRGLPARAAEPRAVRARGAARARGRAVSSERGAKAAVSRSIAALSEREGMLGVEVLVLVPGGDEATAARAAETMLREMQASLAGYTFALGRSRIAADPVDLPRAASEALLAA